MVFEILYDKLIYVLKTTEEWSHELQGFLENWKFPCVRVSDGFYVYVSSLLKHFNCDKK